MMVMMQATEVELPGDVSAVTRRSACDGVGVDVLLTPAVVAALIPGSVAPLPKAVIHAFRVRLVKQGMPVGAVFYDACATSPSETDRWMHGPMFISWLRGARVFKAEANADAKAAAELAIEAVERLMDNGGGVEAAVAPAAAPAGAAAPHPEFCAAMAYAIEAVRGRSPPLPRNSPCEFRGESCGEFRGEFLSNFKWRVRRSFFKCLTCTITDMDDTHMNDGDAGDGSGAAGRRERGHAACCVRRRRGGRALDPGGCCRANPGLGRASAKGRYPCLPSAACQAGHARRCGVLRRVCYLPIGNGPVDARPDVHQLAARRARIQGGGERGRQGSCRACHPGG